MNPRPTCRRCRRPLRVCYCAHLPSLPTRTRVVLVQHPREEGMPIGTAHMASLCLPNSTLHVGTCVRDMPALQAALNDPERPAALLYPGDDATDLFTAPPTGPLTLVVVDGTWSQARKLVRLNPELSRLPRFAFRAPQPSEYRIRKEPTVEVVSTIESLAQALGLIEGDEARFRGLLVPFRAMVDAQIACQASASRRETRRRDTAEARQAAPLAELQRGAADLVCVVAECNMWPHNAPERQVYPSELVQWLAVRLATGERFEALVRPTGPIAPRTAAISGLTHEAIEAGISGAELDRAFRSFLRPQDVLCAWGRNGREIYTTTTGVAPPEAIDLRHLWLAVAHRGFGSLTDVAASTGRVGAPLGRGRAGRNLAAVQAVVEDLLAEAIRSSRTACT